MPSRKVWDQYGINHITFTICGWIDIFARKDYKDMIIENLKYCQEHKGLHISGYVIMSNHIHLLASAEEGNESISAIIRDFKKHTSKEMIRMINEISESRREWLLELFKKYGMEDSDNKNYKVWQSGNHPTLLWTLKHMWKNLGYIHNNPVKAGYVYDAKDYLYSSALTYEDESKGLLKIDLLPIISEVEWKML
jgi:REP element-mobilizing transposase RayT